MASCAEPQVKEPDIKEVGLMTAVHWLCKELSKTLHTALAMQSFQQCCHQLLMLSALCNSVIHISSTKVPLDWSYRKTDPILKSLSHLLSKTQVTMTIQVKRQWWRLMYCNHHKPIYAWNSLIYLIDLFRCHPPQSLVTLAWLMHCWLHAGSFI